MNNLGASNLFNNLPEQEFVYRKYANYASNNFLLMSLQSISNIKQQL